MENIALQTVFAKKKEEMGSLKQKSRSGLDLSLIVPRMRDDVG